MDEATALLIAQQVILQPSTDTPTQPITTTQQTETDSQAAAAMLRRNPETFMERYGSSLTAASVNMMEPVAATNCVVSWHLNECKVRLGISTEQRRIARHDHAPQEQRARNRRFQYMQKLIHGLILCCSIVTTMAEGEYFDDFHIKSRYPTFVGAVRWPTRTTGKESASWYPFSEY